MLLTLIFFQCKAKKEVVSDTSHQVILVDNNSQTITINNSYKEPIKSVLLYDKERELVKQIEKLPTNQPLTVSSKGVYIVHVFTFKTMHIKYIKPYVK